MEKKPRFESKADAIAFYENARISPSKCYAILKEGGFADETGEAKENVSLEFGFAPYVVREGNMWEGAPKIEYRMGMVRIVRREVRRTGALVRPLKFLPMEDFFSPVEEEGIYPKCCLAMDKESAPECAAKFCKHVVRQIGIAEAAVQK